MTLEILTSDLLSPVTHGFFTRKGGASSGIFDGLNCGLGSSDQREAVTLNRARVAEAMGASEDALIGIHQVHSPTVTTIVEPQSGEDRPRADGMVTNVPGLVLGILTADCQPVLFSEPDAGVVGAAHAGWRGTLDGVLEATIDAMVDIGARRDKIRAVIGPSISQAAYEVGPEFFDSFMSQSPGNSHFFQAGKGDRYMFDLPGLGLSKLNAAGIASAAWTGHCTYQDAARFYSYRRTTHASEVDYGRLISCIRL
ncbi:peptidoglycan editing factor PgeF [Epibacterium ulvae]|uniref:peptidoglycan editing factor PgeF n=1 Tax=Epibacterium ulvae TaxID=1156985 RepID=UPI001BFC2653|nr:peptidoglycan editing factor PgeF [Epibacterium ulvae]MBT8154919.1 peptidoglycan editing factor PgeF [Epibacterium ulvae]